MKSLKFARWLGVTPSGGWCLEESWPFASPIHWGAVMAWAIVSDDGYEEGPFDTLCEAWQWAH